MSNFNVLARRFAARLLRRGAPTRRASETGRLVKTKSGMILSQRKNSKILKNFLQT
jgi:hypothetical protein